MKENLSRLQKLPDELLSLIGQCMEVEDFLEFLESLRLDPRRQVSYQGVGVHKLRLHVGSDREASSWRIRTNGHSRRRRREEAAPSFRRGTGEHEDDEIYTTPTALNVLEAFPQVVDLSLYVSFEDDVLPLLASERVQNLSSLELEHDERHKGRFFDVAAFEAMVCGAERRGPQVIISKIVPSGSGELFEFSKTFRMPDGEHHFALRCSFERWVSKFLVPKFRQDVIGFVRCPDNLLPSIIYEPFYEACEYFVDASLVNDDAAIELFIDQFPDREVIYQFSPSADIDFLVERYRNRRVVLLDGSTNVQGIGDRWSLGEVVSLGVNPPDDIEELSHIVSRLCGPAQARHTVTVLDPNRRRPTIFPNPNEQGIHLCQLLDLDPVLRRRRYLNNSPFGLVSFDVEAARRSPEIFRQDLKEHTWESYKVTPYWDPRRRRTYLEESG